MRCLKPVRTKISTVLLVSLTVLLSVPASAREVRVKDAVFTSGTGRVVIIEMQTQGDEAAVGFTLRFDPTRLRFEDVVLGQGAQEALLLTNSVQAANGALGIALARAPGRVLSAGQLELLRVMFRVETISGQTLIGLDDQLVARRVANAEAGALSSDFVGGKVDVRFAASGTVKYYAGSGAIPGTTVNLTGGSITNALTQSDGTFSLLVDGGTNYTISPTKPIESPASQGVTTLDISLVRRHILGLAPLDSPYKILAADVNGSGSVTTLDVTLMRRVILGLTNNYPAGTLWRFVRSNFEFTDPQAPWTFEATRDIAGLTGDVSEQDFVGIRLGDVNGSWTPAAGAVVEGLSNASSGAGALKGPAKFQ